MKIFAYFFIIISIYLYSFLYIFEKNGFTQELPGTETTLEMVLVSGDNGRNDSLNLGGQADFYISRYETTWDLYKLFIDRNIDELEFANRSDQVAFPVDAVTGATTPYVDMSMGMGSGAGLPACNVTPLSASRFCQWLSAITGRFYRLPTEEEWKTAAYTGIEEVQSLDSDTSGLGEFAWYSANSNNSYHKVGTKKPNGLGLYDMYGNVAEWTLKKINPGNGGKENFKPVLKGGAFHLPEKLINTEDYLESQPKWKERDPQFPRSKWWYTDAGFAGFRVVSPVITPPEANFDLYWNIQ